MLQKRLRRFRTERIYKTSLANIISSPVFVVIFVVAAVNDVNDDDESRESG